MRPVLGVGMVGLSVVMVFGGITGRLAPMLAAIFAPSLLKDKDTGGDVGGIVGTVVRDAIGIGSGTWLP